MRVREIKESIQERSEGNLENGMKDNVKENLRIVIHPEDLKANNQVIFAETPGRWPRCEDFFFF